MEARIISVSAAAYDGYEVPEMLDSLAACGAGHVEPAFIVGYTEPFDERVFSDAHAARYAGWLEASGIACHAFSAHIDLGGADAATVFAGRMRFARRLGARIINTNASPRDAEAAFLGNIEALAREAEALDMVICLENPGDARSGLFDVATDGAALVERIGSPRVRLNYDPGNTVSHRPDIDAITDAIAALPASAHLHLKAARATPDGWHYEPLDRGDLDFAPLLQALAGRPGLAVSVEMPLRMRRGADAQPWRRVAPVARELIEDGVRRSLALLRRGLRTHEAAPP